MAIWTDENHIDENLTNGIGFLMERTSYRNGCVTTWHLLSRPVHTNSSHEPRLTGWCGDTDNVSRYAEGLARVARRAKNGRVCLAKVEPTVALLEELGYPELAEEGMPEGDSEGVRFARWCEAMVTAGVNLGDDEATKRRAYGASVALLG
jgi:hypothetical protein